MERVEDPAPGLVDYSLSHLAIAAFCSREVMCGNNWRTSFRPLNLQIALHVQSSTEFIRSRAHGKQEGEEFKHVELSGFKRNHRAIANYSSSHSDSTGKLSRRVMVLVVLMREIAGSDRNSSCTEGMVM